MSSLWNTRQEYNFQDLGIIHFFLVQMSARALIRMATYTTGGKKDLIKSVKDIFANIDTPSR